MKNKALILILGILLCSGGLIQATIVDFNDYDVGTIQTGDYYDGVGVFNYAYVTMTGGEVGGLSINDSGTFNLQGGNITTISARNTSNLIISGGSVIGSIELGDSVVASISGGNITGTLGMYYTSIAHIYGKNFNFTPDGLGPYGWLTGNWADNSPFTIHYRSSEPFTVHLVLHTIPEPCTFALFGIVSLFLRRRAKLFCK